MNDFEKVKSQVSLKVYAESHLERMKGRYICPSCGSGTGPKKSPAFSIKGDGWKCFSCHGSGDVFDLAGIIHHTEDKREQLRIVAEWAGIPLDPNGDAQPARIQPRTTKNESAKDYTAARNAETEKVRKWQANIEDPAAVSYLQERGISFEQAKAWGMGYAPNGTEDWDHAPRIVIPYPGSDYYHIDRRIDGNDGKFKYLKPKDERVGKQPIWNPSALERDVVFVVEGPLDALAVEACGFGAIATCGSGSAITETTIIGSRYKGAVIVAFDNEEEKKGPAHQASTAATLNSAGVYAQGAEYPPEWPYKDFSDAYSADPEGLAAFLKSTSERASEGLREHNAEAVRETLRNMHAADIDGILNRLYTQDPESLKDPIPTGFNRLDEVLGDGLQHGSLYILGAISSMGKTTLAAHIADNIASGGHPVLFVSVEQSGEEIVSKSLSRIAKGIHFPECGGCPITSQDITNRRRRSQWSEGKELALLKAVESYKMRISPNMTIWECDKQPSADNIEVMISEIERLKGVPPVVIVDYLQLLAPESDRQSDKQAVDSNVRALRQIAKRRKTPIFAISSLNRGSYNGPISMEAFKESGAIEYGSDVLMGLQASGIDRYNDEEEKAAKKKAKALNDNTKRERFRNVELAVLKNRNGALAYGKNAIRFEYDSWCNHFAECR